MNKKSKIILIIFLILVAGSVFASYERYIIRKDFKILTGEQPPSPEE